MRRRVGCPIAISIAAVVCLTYGTAWAQQNWRVPRTADGHPDLQGIWTNNSATPMQRPAAFEGKESLTDEELAVYQARAAELHANEQAGNLLGPLLFQQVLEDPNFREFDAGTGNYNSFWLVERELDNRTSRQSPRRRASVAGVSPARRAAEPTRTSAGACWTAASPMACRICWPATTATFRSFSRPTTSSSCRS